MFQRHQSAQWIRALAATALVVTLVSCGGGSGSSGPIFGPGGSAPTVSITNPANFSTVTSPLLVVNASAADDNAVASVEFQVDGVSIGTPTVAPYSASASTTNYASGQHVVRARATDGDGNVSDWATVTVQFGGTRTQPAGFTRDLNYVAALNNATAFAQASDGRLFIAEQGGTLRVAVSGSVQATPVITLTVDAQGERGLLGVALHPDFDNNAFLYLYYTSTDGTVHNRISRFTVSGNTASLGSEFPIIDLPTLGATNHNGGAIHFGADGKLYVGVGDNANGSNAQSTTTPLGKMLRINDDGTVPSDNPFVATRSGLAQYVWADGLRNPFTFAIQPSSGRIHINDVGESTWEEINLGAAGANYGWPGSEGPDNVGSGITAPIFAYGHIAAPTPGSGPGGFFTGQAITGGTFYPNNGPFGAPYRGGYFFADLTSRFIGFLDLANANAAYTFGSVTGSPVDMLAASDGALLVLTRSNIVRFSKP